MLTTGSRREDESLANTDGAETRAKLNLAKCLVGAPTLPIDVPAFGVRLLDVLFEVNGYSLVFGLEEPAFKVRYPSHEARAELLVEMVPPSLDVSKVADRVCRRLARALTESKRAEADAIAESARALLREVESERERPTSLPGVDIPKVEIELTHLCNNRCGFCSSGWYNAEKQTLPFMSRERISLQLKAALDGGLRRALFQGGEPTLFKELGEVVHEAWDLGFDAVNVFTNARIAASDKGLAWLLDMNVTWWQISVQGGTEEMHDESVRRRNAFKQTVAGTRRLIEAGERVKINGVLTIHLLESIEAFAELMISLRPEEVGMDTVKPLAAFAEGRLQYGDEVPSYKPYAAALRRALVRMNDAGVSARVTSFAPCLAPGVEPFVSEEPTHTVNYFSDPQKPSRNKMEKKQSMKVKVSACRDCAYDAVCDGIYRFYVDAHGESEFRPLPERIPSYWQSRKVADETELTRALAHILLESGQVPALDAIVPSGDDRHRLEFSAPDEFRASIEPGADESARFGTARFAIRFNGTDADLTDERAQLLEQVTQLIAEHESHLVGALSSP